MQTPWQILELDPGSASEKDIKIAYAKLVKLHRPDIDPEGFRRVREAYEIGLAVIRESTFEATRTTASTPVSTPQATLTSPAPTETTSAAEPPLGIESPTLPPSLTDAENAVHRAQTASDQAAAARAIGSLFFTCRLIDAGSAGIRLWQESLHRVTGGRSDLVAAGVTCTQLLAEMEAGSSIIAHACIGHWEAVGDTDSMVKLAEAMLSEPRRVDAPEAALVALRLALETGFPSPALSMRMVNLAFPHLDRETREQLLPRIEQQSQTGAIFAGFRDDQMRFWHQRFRRPSASWNWNDPAAEAAIEYLASAHYSEWSGYELLKEVAPANWLERLQLAQKNKAEAKAASSVVGHVHRAKYGFKIPIFGWLNLIWLMPLLAYLSVSVLTRKPERTKPTVVSPGWSSLSPATDNSGRSPLPAASTNSTAEAQRGQRVEELLKQPGVQSWNQLLRTMVKNNPVTDEQAAAMPTLQAFLPVRSAIQNLFQGISKAEPNPSVEQYVLELLVIDPSAALLLKQEAVYRQATTLPPDVFLPTWKQEASGSQQLARSIGQMAEIYLMDPTKRLMLSTAEAHDMGILARAAPKPATPAP